MDKKVMDKFLDIMDSDTLDFAGDTHVTFRVDDSRLQDGFLNGLIQKGLMLLVRETLDKHLKPCDPHFHGYAIVNLNTFRNHFKAYYKGNGQYSIKTKIGDPEAAIHYICKGEGYERYPDVRWQHPHFDYDTCKMHEAYWEINNELKSNLKKRKRETKGALEQVYNEVNKDHFNQNSSALAIGVAIMDWYIEKRRVLPNSFAMNGMISTYVAWLVKDETEDEPMPRVHVDLFRRLYNRLELV